MNVSKRQSVKLNDAILQIETENQDYDCWPDMDSGKAFPYIGWVWREIDFTSDSCYLGVIPKIPKSGPLGEYNPRPKVGFMVNNKWGYEGFILKGVKWDRLRTLVIEAVKLRTSASFDAVRDFMQTLKPRRK